MKTQKNRKSPFYPSSGKIEEFCLPPTEEGFFEMLRQKAKKNQKKSDNKKSTIILEVTFWKNKKNKTDELTKEDIKQNTDK